MIALLRPHAWGAHLVMVLAVAAAVALGLWQLDAWHQHRDDAARDLTTSKPVALGSVMGGDDPFPGDQVGHPVTVRGTWLASGTVYVRDRRHDGRTGYWVVTPLAVDGTRSAMPVVRGWSPEASAPAVQGSARLTGWLQPGEGEGLPDDDPDDDVVPELRIPSLVQHVDRDLYSAYVIAQQPTTGLAGVHPSQAPTVGQTTALRNLLYAIQWWVFGGFAVLIWLRWCRDVLHPPDPDEETQGADGAAEAGAEEPAEEPSVGSSA